MMTARDLEQSAPEANTESSRSGFLVRADE
jgi:hypothetical protein